jgi:hypothetical protein
VTSRKNRKRKAARKLERWRRWRTWTWYDDIVRSVFAGKTHELVPSWSDVWAPHDEIKRAYGDDD